MAGASLTNEQKAEIVAAIEKHEKAVIHLKTILFQHHSPFLYLTWSIPELLAKIAVDAPELDLAGYQAQWDEISASPTAEAESALRKTLLDMVLRCNQREAATCPIEVRSDSDLAAQNYLLRVKINALSLARMSIEAAYQQQAAYVVILSAQIEAMQNPGGTATGATLQVVELAKLRGDLATVMLDNTNLQRRIQDLNTELKGFVAWFEHTEKKAVKQTERKNQLKAAIILLQDKVKALQKKLDEEMSISAQRLLENLDLQREQDKLQAEIAELKRRLAEKASSSTGYSYLSGTTPASAARARSVTGRPNPKVAHLSHLSGVRTPGGAELKR